MQKYYGKLPDHLLKRSKPFSFLSNSLKDGFNASKMNLVTRTKLMPWDAQVAPTVKNPPAVQETQV